MHEREAREREGRREFPNRERGPAFRLRVAPPAPRAEMRTEAPSPQHMWVRGFWGYQDGRHVWIEGRWALPPAQGRGWIEPRWVLENGEWAFYSGYWEPAAAAPPPAASAPAYAEPPPAEVTITIGPPHRRAERVPRQPGNGYVWIAGDWIWDGHQYRWAAGRWEAPRSGWMWVAPYWQTDGSQYRWRPGYWKRR
jgi:hypothetical protein